MKEFIKLIKIYYKHTKDFKKDVIIFTITLISFTIIDLVVPIFAAKELIYMTGSLFEQLLNVSLFLFGMEIIRNITRFFYWRSFNIYYTKSLKRIQSLSLQSTLGIKNKSLDEVPSGLVIERINSDCSKMSEIIPNMMDNFGEIVTNIGRLITVFMISKVFFLYLLVAAGVIFIFKNIRIKKWFEYDKKRRKLNERVTSFVVEFIRGIRDIKVLNAGKNFMNEANNRIDEKNRLLLKSRNSMHGYDLVTDCLTDTFTILLIILGIVFMKNKLITVASFIIVYQYRNYIYNAFRTYTVITEQVNDFKLSASRVFELIEGDKFLRESFGTRKLKKANGDFEFNKVNFSYKDGITILKDMSFKIDANTTTAFVGKSGTGKTTVFNLLAKLYETDSGTITIDGIDINELDEDSIRGNMTIINQTPYIFNLSIYDNLKICAPKATKKDIKEACKLANLDEFINSLPDKYDTMVGEGGISLSGGQRQRLAIARALIQKTEIILFDEATSALDNETQDEIQKAIDNMKNEYTILIIAHRFSTVINSDKIMYMEDGKIKAEGTHQELLKKCKGYKELYELELKNN